MIRAEDLAEAEIECLCKLLTNIGIILEQTVAARMQVYFVRIEALSKNESIPSRLRFKLIDLMDLRKQAWNGPADNGPRTLAEIQKSMILISNKPGCSSGGLKRSNVLFTASQDSRAQKSGGSSRNLTRRTVTHKVLVPLSKVSNNPFEYVLTH